LYFSVLTLVVFQLHFCYFVVLSRSEGMASEFQMEHIKSDCKHYQQCWWRALVPLLKST
jgi:hypothetical protein